MPLINSVMLYEANDILFCQQKHAHKQCVYSGSNYCIETVVYKSDVSFFLSF